MTRGFLWGQLAFGDALVAGEIAVRGYVSEATGHKQRHAASRPVRCAVFERQPAAGQQVPGGPINKSGQGRQSIAARASARARLVAQAVFAEHRVIGGDVGRIADQGVETAACRARRTSRPDAHSTPSTGKARAVAPRHLERSVGSVGAEHAPARTFMGQRDGDRTRAGAEVRDVRIGRAARDRSTRCTNSSVSGRGTSTAGLTAKSSDQNSRRPRR